MATKYTVVLETKDYRDRKKAVKQVREIRAALKVARIKDVKVAVYEVIK